MTRGGSGFWPGTSRSITQHGDCFRNVNGLGLSSLSKSSLRHTDSEEIETTGRRQITVCLGKHVGQ
jgi:hypothetical protein